MTDTLIIAGLAGLAALGCYAGVAWTAWRRGWEAGLADSCVCGLGRAGTCRALSEDELRQAEYAAGRRAWGEAVNHGPLRPQRGMGKPKTYERETGR